MAVNKNNIVKAAISKESFLALDDKKQTEELRKILIIDYLKAADVVGSIVKAFLTEVGMYIGLKNVK